ncbi:peptidase [Paracoccus sp. TK19116]|uniref:Peptidase n=1 Tax=Paracoccus albicereus TaxID=2922394 RepID=A0ABT1MU65_9RHOB|nr:peptidase [Paracoccus albicereus]MCQ0971877.1 peptidase [Paracoccus albicereus]
MTADVVDMARRWIGTPYIHQHSANGAGTDCLGLIRGLWRERYGSEPEVAPAYTPDWGECGREEVLLAGALRHLRPVHAAAVEVPGEVLLFRMRQGGVAKHLGVLSETGEHAAFIHAYDRHGVVESPLSTPWRRRIAARFLFP